MRWLPVSLVLFELAVGVLCTLLFVRTALAEGGPIRVQVADQADAGTAGAEADTEAEADVEQPAAALADRTSQEEEEGPFQPANWLRGQPPIAPAPPLLTDFEVTAPPAAAEISSSIFAPESVRRSLISQSRRRQSLGPGWELVFGSEGKFRVTTDGGNLLGKSNFAPAVRTQPRTPIVNDPRVRSERVGRLLSSGSYWVPAREDLDTMLSKIDSRIIQDVVVIKGPYSARYGPGFSFVDFLLLPAPRYEGGFEAHGSTSLEYKTNGAQWYGRQSVWGGGEDYGFRVGYGHRTGSDYRTGIGSELPTSYNSRDIDVAVGVDLSDRSHLEFNYLRLDQTDVEFPGLVFDINFLVTDGYELRYVLEDQPYFDLLTVEGWYNRTRFEGDTSRPGKNLQIPSLRPNFGLDNTEFLVTDVDGMSAGYRVAFTWGQLDQPRWTLGTDLIRVGQQLNDIVPEHDEPTGLPFPFPPSVTIPQSNFPIPRARSLDVGLFVEHARPVDDRLTVNLGARVDFVATDAVDRVPGLGILTGFPPTLVETGLSELKDAGLNQHFLPWMVYATADYEVDCCWTIVGGAGYSERPPTLTELYAAGPFIGSLQPGLTFLEGDPELDPERLAQIDLGVRADLGSFRMGLYGFHAWINDYIIYEDVAIRNRPPFPPFEPGQDLQQAAFGNTELATLAGFELAAEQDVGSWLTGFALMSYVEGRDHTRSRPSRIATKIRTDNGIPAGPRSLVAGVEKEPLPGIPPLEARLGLRLHEPFDQPSWGVELEARIVDNQDRVARSLFEEETPGFTVWNLRGYWQAFDDLLLLAGVENFTDRYYREHLDFRSGRGVFQPGVNFYFVGELTY